MKRKDLYWLAGLLEGEGSFLKPSPSSPNKLRITCQMTDEDIISKIANLFGVSYQTYQPSNSKWKIIYIVAITGLRAVDMMHKIKPFMGKRRQQQIDNALAEYDPNLRYKNRKLKKVGC